MSTTTTTTTTRDRGDRYGPIEWAQLNADCSGDGEHSLAPPPKPSFRYIQKIKGNLPFVKLEFHDADTDTDILAMILANTSKAQFPEVQ